MFVKVLKHVLNESNENVPLQRWQINKLFSSFCQDKEGIINNESFPSVIFSTVFVKSPGKNSSSSVFIKVKAFFAWKLKKFFLTLFQYCWHNLSVELVWQSFIIKLLLTHYFPPPCYNWKKFLWAITTTRYCYCGNFTNISLKLPFNSFKCFESISNVNHKN